MITENDPALFACYEWAIIRLATALPVKERSNPPLLVFASVEFVHSDRPRPDSTPLDERGVPPHTRGEGPSGMRVYFRRMALAAADALRWYRDVAKGALTVPIPNDPKERGRHDGEALRGPVLVDEPPWPKLVFPMVDSSLFSGSKATYPTPFLGPGAAPARIHRLMAAADPDLEALSRDNAACDWLAPRIHFRIDEYTDLLGAAVLIAPDPQVAGVKQFFTRDASKKEVLVTLVQARAKQSLKGLDLTVFEERFGAISTFRHVAVPADGIVVTEPPAEIRASGYMLAHPERGLIDFQPPTPFIRTVGFTMETSTRRVRLQTRDSKKKDAEVIEHEFPETTVATSSLVGDTEGPLSAHERFWQAAAMRRSNNRAHKADQRWIDDPTTARAFLRGLIGSAREEVLVADCFFNGEDLADYLHFVRRLNVSLKALTSQEAFNAAPDRASAIRGMQASIKSFHERGIQNVLVRVMHNKDGKPILHGRFVAVDSAVWFSDNSLNAIGQRESLIIKLPDPAPVIERLNRIFETEADDFSSFVDLG
jgi:hypothetical protein